MPNAGGEATALSEAVWGGHAEVVSLLLHNGARMDATGGKYYPTIFDYARQHSSCEILNLLEEMGGQPSLRWLELQAWRESQTR